MSSRRRGREKRRKRDPIEAAFAEAARAVARKDLDAALAWTKVTRALEEAERRAGLHRRAEERLAAVHARNEAAIAAKEKALDRRRNAVEEEQLRVSRLTQELRRLKARLTQPNRF